MSGCGDYFALPDLTCGLVAGHEGVHLAVPRGDRRRFRWVTLADGRRYWPTHPVALRESQSLPAVANVVERNKS